MNLTTNKQKRSRRRSEKDKANAPHSDLLLISFLIPVIALSGVNLKPVMVPAEFHFGALDGS